MDRVTCEPARAARGVRGLDDRSGSRGSARSSRRHDLKRSLSRALEAEPELAPGVERSMVRAFWSRRPLELALPWQSMFPGLRPEPPATPA